MMVRFFRTRSASTAMIALVVGGASLTLGMLLAGMALPASLLISLGIVVSFAGLGLVTFWSSRAQRRQLIGIREATSRSRDAAGSIGRIAPIVREIRSDSHQLRRELEELHRQLRELSELTAGEHAIERIEPPSALSPRIVSAFKSERNPSKRPGRVGASFSHDPESGVKLRRLLDDPVGEQLPTVGHIVSERLRESIAEGAVIVSVLPGYRGARDAPDLAYLVVEDRALWTGPWAGAVDAAGHSLFVQLRDLAKRSRAQGTVTVFVETGRPVAAFSDSLVGLFDVVVANRDIIAASASTAVLDIIRAYAKGA